MGKEITTRQPDRAPQLWTLSADSNLTDEDRATLIGFFLELKTIFGVGKYEAQFGKTADEQLLCMRGWAPTILQYTDERLIEVLQKVRRNVGPDHWININEILNCVTKQWTEGTDEREALGLTEQAFAEMKAGRLESGAKQLASLKQEALNREMFGEWPE